MKSNLEKILVAIQRLWYISRSSRMNEAEKKKMRKHVFVVHSSRLIGKAFLRKNPKQIAEDRA